MGASSSFWTGKLSPFGTRDLTTGMVAAACGVAPRTVTKWVDRGLIPGCYRIPTHEGANVAGRVSGGDRRIPARACLKFLESMGHHEAVRRLQHMTSLLVTAVGVPEGDLLRLRELLLAHNASVVLCQCLFAAGIQMSAQKSHVLLIDLPAVGASSAAHAAARARAMEQKPLAVGVFHPDDVPAEGDFDFCVAALPDAGHIVKIASYLENAL